MFRSLLFACCLLPLAAFAVARAFEDDLATCTGADPCRACKNCKYCKYCSKPGQTCGVCKR